MKIRKEITHENYIVEIEDPILYVDNRKRGRSRHMSHAPAEFVYISENAAGWDEGTLIASKKTSAHTIPIMLICTMKTVIFC